MKSSLSYSEHFNCTIIKSLSRVSCFSDTHHLPHWTSSHYHSSCTKDCQQRHLLHSQLNKTPGAAGLKHMTASSCWNGLIIMCQPMQKHQCLMCQKSVLLSNKGSKWRVLQWCQRTSLGSEKSISVKRTVFFIVWITFESSKDHCPL